MSRSDLDAAWPRATRAAALAALDAFVPETGEAYARHRNRDCGPDQPGHVSRLSPWIRHRLISEAEVAGAVLAQHAPEAAEKFLQELCWRSYWKGWLELRPAVWDRYRVQVADDLESTSRDTALHRRLHTAMRGETSIAGFDDWVHELVATGYLHNHARMWFASIWIFTLKLPWALGADWFLRHLLDGDPASNTLSWRWVAGLHTPGKTYLARADNIRRHSARPFEISASQLAARAPACSEAAPPPPAGRLAAAETPTLGLRSGLLLTEDDTSAEHWLAVPASDVVAVAGLNASRWRSPLAVAAPVLAFSDQALGDAIARAVRHWQAEAADPAVTSTGEALRNWIDAHRLKQLIIPWVPCGAGRDRLAEVLGQAGVPSDVRVCQPRRPWDDYCWPLASSGFFRFWKALPDWRTLLG